jgi:hypothetical protein
MRVHGRLRVTQSSKHNSFTFYFQILALLLQTLISCLSLFWRRLEADLAGLPMLDQPRTLLP